MPCSRSHIVVARVTALRYVADVRSEHAQHLRENLQLGNFSLTASELATLTNLPPQDAIWFKDLDTMP